MVQKLTVYFLFCSVNYWGSLGEGHWKFEQGYKEGQSLNDCILNA
jgi:hypothetical protein